jgi:hypothetical protein
MVNLYWPGQNAIGQEFLSLGQNETAPGLAEMDFATQELC